MKKKKKGKDKRSCIITMKKKLNYFQLRKMVYIFLSMKEDEKGKKKTGCLKSHKM